MNAGLKMFLLSATSFALALGAERPFVPDTVPIAFAEEPQPQWAVQLAFFLRTVEGMAAIVAMISLSLTLVLWMKRRLRHHRIP
jgi:hypothetical protein